jgi:hypothetical protein
VASSAASKKRFIIFANVWTIGNKISSFITSEIAIGLDNVYGEAADSHSTVFQWINMIHSENLSR